MIAGGVGCVPANYGFPVLAIRLRRRVQLPDCA